VNRLILNPGQTRKKPKGEAPPKQQEAAKPKTEADKPKDFVWNPNPNKADLI